MLDEYAQYMIRVEEQHAAEVDALLRPPGETAALQPLHRDHSMICGGR